ncbi:MULTISPECIES: class I SAM-dependent methyltransferase [Bacillus cereus group]|uniref:Class I SAM-dependent methyltransferase n=1 Tax=Bacillus paramycoides TaxID=2026194 RepID=A0ABU6MQE8_9BACI|nr:MULTISPECIES: class I SAM-dependent methyltransferase [Bacillus cereus group]MED0969931.1 class I SAM-dependent methyltransferase [Bacillus paramycoides]MED0979935.1 class I SAM-dependent methyltransferase [Bacillus paramycoides]MED1092336.1 class I SAM-dependent methyltransferase [Bacillus paramycoides]MED1103833.1 class I SAM-dependent methyltransferase [Bacillus paramycoides]MED1564936.1 class I SAM-dependent methyltransferase [Bacillus paramycoides]
MNQKQLSTINEKSWNAAAYEAWTNRHGAPAEYAKKLMQDPVHEVAYYLPYIHSPKGKRIINLLGSKGNKAVALALLGADVTVVDISASNEKYATELAKAAGVSIQYIVSDVLDLNLSQSFDIVLLELGVLHYFLDLKPLFHIISNLLKQDGTFILRDYHPVYTKLLGVDHPAFRANGNYFGEELIEDDVAYSTLLTESQKKALPRTKIRRWTLGEIITAMAETNFKVEKLIEEHGPHQRWVFPPTAPEGIEERIPGLYTLIATTCKKGSLHG